MMKIILGEDSQEKVRGLSFGCHKLATLTLPYLESPHSGTSVHQ